MLTLQIEENRQHYFLFFNFKKGKNGTERLCLNDQTYQNCFVKFSAGDFLLNDAPQFARSVETDSD